ncbi:MAG: 2-hydroxyacyl-CoA dehydratase [Candidatus Lokiarchaeota archaeon]|nr:2-hydroxyacyl-CoA dehydratase [Candidatus Lokiarchaeota archaeon]
MNDTELLLEYYEYLKEQKIQGNKKIVAFMGHDNVPEELIDAFGMIPLRMMFAGNDELMNISNDYLPPSTCSFAQSCIGLFSSKPNAFKFLDLVDFFIVSNHCVSDACCSEIITKYFNIPRINFFVSYTQTTEALKYLKLELLDLKEQLEKISGKAISSEEIIASLKKYDIFKKKIAKLHDLKIRSAEKLKLIQKAILYGPAFSDEISKILQKLEKTDFQEHENNVVSIIFTGCSIFIGDYLIDLIEDSGGNVVFFDTWIGSNYYSDVLQESDYTNVQDPIDLFVKRFAENLQGDHFVPNFLENKVNFLDNLVKKYAKKDNGKVGVINHIIKFCDHINIFQTFLKQKLQDRDIRVLNLERDYSRSNRGQLSTRIEAFMEMM